MIVVDRSKDNGGGLLDVLVAFGHQCPRLSGSEVFWKGERRDVRIFSSLESRGRWR